MDTGATRGFYTADPLLPAHLALFAALAALALAAARLPAQRRARVWNVLRWAAPVLGAGVGLLLLWMVVGLRMQPTMDDAGALEVAQKLLAGDTSPLTAGGYVYRFPAQIGIIGYDMLFLHVFGTDAVLAMQIANVLWLLFGAAALADAAACLWGCPQRRALCFCVILLWLPAGLYVTFVYGTLPALALSMAQLWCFARWHVRRRLPWCVLGAVCGALAALLKQNYLVFSIACCLYLLWQTLRAACTAPRPPVRAWAMPLAGAALVPVLYLAALRLPLAAVYAGTGMAPGSGKAASAWLLTGMQDLGASEGWVNTDSLAVDDYLAAHGRAATDQYCRQRIAGRLAEFRADPAMAVRFFARKTTSQWNMPTFQALAVNRNHPIQTDTVPWALALLANGRQLNALFLAFCDLVLTQLWAWSLVWLLLGRRRGCPEDLLLAVVFAGGFVLQLVWEAKARNTLIYAFVLLPCAVQGWCALGTAARAGAAAAPQKKLRTLWPVLPAAALLLLSGVSGQYLSCDRAEAAAQLAAYRQWQAEQAPDLPRGPCLIFQAQSGLALADGHGGEAAHLCTSAEREVPFTVLPLFDRLLLDGVPQTHACQLLFAPENELAVGFGSDGDGYFAVPKPGTDPFLWAQQWHLHKQPDGTWTLCIMDTEGNYLALTDTGGEALTFAPETGAPEQCWRIEPIAPIA